MPECRGGGAPHRMGYRSFRNIFTWKGETGCPNAILPRTRLCCLRKADPPAIPPAAAAAERTKTAARPDGAALPIRRKARCGNAVTQTAAAVTIRSDAGIRSGPNLPIPAGFAAPSCTTAGRSPATTAAQRSRGKRRSDPLGAKNRAGAFMGVCAVSVCRKSGLQEKVAQKRQRVCPLEAGMALSIWYLAACGPRFFMIYCPRRARRSRISRSAERDQGSAQARDFLKKIE